MDNYELTEDDMEVAIVVSRLSDELLYRYLGLALRSEDNGSLFLLLELLSNAVQSALAELDREGRQYSQDLLARFKPLICQKHDYCNKRRSLGLGDPRLFINWTANTLVVENLVSPTSKLMIPISVIIIRSQLSDLCKCEHRIGVKP